MAYIYRDITYSSLAIGSCSIHAEHGSGYQRAIDIPYTDVEIEKLDTEKKIGVLYIEVR